MNTKDVAVVETAEGCQSCVIATQDFVIRNWLESQEPDVLGGLVEAVSIRGGDALHGRERAAFIFHDGRAGLMALVEGCSPADVMADPRFEMDRDHEN